MNANPPPRPRFSSRHPPPRRATARRGRPGGLPRFTTGSARDAINLRWNYKDAINLATGEWTHAGYRAPACYVHSADGRARFAWRVEPAACTGLCVSAAGASVIGGSDDRRFALDVSGQTPGPAGTVGASFSVGSVQPPFFGENVLFGNKAGNHD